MTQIINENAAAAGGNNTIAIGGYVNSTTGNNTGTGVFPSAGAYGGEQAPDVVANLRVDQTWGSAQAMVALHEVNATYYSSAAGANGIPGTGHASDQWGFAAGGGLRLNFPMVAQGDYFQTQVNYAQGALRYLFNTPNRNWGMVNGCQWRVRHPERLRLRRCSSRGTYEHDELPVDHRLGHQRLL